MIELNEVAVFTAAVATVTAIYYVHISLHRPKSSETSEKAGDSYSKDKISPKVFIISMFKLEAEAWDSHFDLNARKFRVPGLPSASPDVRCTADGSVCQVIVGMGLINAALSISSVVSSHLFSLSKTYFLVAGVAGIPPSIGTLGSVILARYIVQTDLQYELDAREILPGWHKGYFPFGAHSSIEKPKIFYGTEVFELNAELRDVAVKFAQKAQLKDDLKVKEYCKRFPGGSNDFSRSSFVSEYRGSGLSKSVDIFTNGAAIYDATAQEDSGILAALLRGAVDGQVDPSRVIVMRAASNFDQPPNGELPEIPLHAGHGGFELALENIGRACRQIVSGIVDNWDETFLEGIIPSNYVGDVFATLGGSPPFGMQK